MNFLLSIVFWLLINWEIVWKVLAVVWIVLGLLPFFILSEAESHSLRSPGVFLCLLGTSMLFWIWNATSAVNEAAGILTLPKEAQVLSVEEGDWAGDGAVTFKLPTNHPPKFWLDQIWKVNGTRQGLVPREGVNFQSNEKEISYLGDEYNIDLRYDDATQKYSYTAELPK